MKCLSILLFCTVIFSCHNAIDDEQVPLISRTVIVYMAADNDLSMDAAVDMEEMKQGFVAADGARLVVFIDRSDDTPRLIEIGEDGTETVLKEYDELNSALAATLENVIQDAIALCPAAEYGLILWSHGQSWLPAGVAVRSFAQDGSNAINISELADALPLHFNFILMDACLMGAVEVVYELKDKADYIIASSTETIYEGFPYSRIMPVLLTASYSSEAPFAAAAESYFEYYDAIDGEFRSATISVVDTRELEEVARLTQALYAGFDFEKDYPERGEVQRLDVYTEQYTFDFWDFVDKSFPDVSELEYEERDKLRTSLKSGLETRTPELKRDLKEQLERVVVYKAHTPQFLMEYDITTYCGLSCYIPHPDRPDLNEFYKTLKWAQAIASLR